MFHKMHKVVICAARRIKGRSVREEVKKSHTNKTTYDQHIETNVHKEDQKIIINTAPYFEVNFYDINAETAMNAFKVLIQKNHQIVIFSYSSM